LKDLLDSFPTVSSERVLSGAGLIASTPFFVVARFGRSRHG
jgi:glucokinase